MWWSQQDSKIFQTLVDRAKDAPSGESAQAEPQQPQPAPQPAQPPVAAPAEPPAPPAPPAPQPPVAPAPQKTEAELINERINHNKESAVDLCARIDNLRSHLQTFSAAMSITPADTKELDEKLTELQSGMQPGIDALCILDEFDNAAANCIASLQRYFEIVEQAERLNSIGALKDQLCVTRFISEQEEITVGCLKLLKLNTQINIALQRIDISNAEKNVRDILVQLKNADQNDSTALLAASTNLTRLNQTIENGKQAIAQLTSNLRMLDERINMKTNTQDFLQNIEDLNQVIHAIQEDNINFQTQLIEAQKQYNDTITAQEGINRALQQLKEEAQIHLSDAKKENILQEIQEDLLKYMPEETQTQKENDQSDATQEKDESVTL